MSVGYELVNFSRRERISFAHIAATSARELAGYPPAAAIVTWYLLTHRGDNVAFVSDSLGDWPFPGTRSDLDGFADVTDEAVAQLIAEGILADDGRDHPFADDPDVYLRRLRNRWMDDAS